MTFEVKTCNDLSVFILTRKLLYPLKKKVRNQRNVTFKQYIPVFFQNTTTVDLEKRNISLDRQHRLRGLRTRDFETRKANGSELFSPCNLSSHNRIYIAKYLFSIRDD